VIPTWSHAPNPRASFEDNPAPVGEKTQSLAVSKLGIDAPEIEDAAAFVFVAVESGGAISCESDLPNPLKEVGDDLVEADADLALPRCGLSRGEMLRLPVRSQVSERVIEATAVGAVMSIG